MLIDKIRTANVVMSETDKGFVATLYINGQKVHATYPQLSRKNAILLINRKIERISKLNNVRLKPYKE